MGNNTNNMAPTQHVTPLKKPSSSTNITPIWSSATGLVGPITINPITPAGTLIKSNPKTPNPIPGSPITTPA